MDVREYEFINNKKKDHHSPSHYLIGRMRGQRRRRPIETKMVTVQKKEGTDTLFLFFPGLLKNSTQYSKMVETNNDTKFFKVFFCDFNQNATFFILENLFFLF